MYLLIWSHNLRMKIMVPIKLRLFSIHRLFAIIVKEFIQMLRDRITFTVMIIGIPLLQLILFGYAINSNPKNLPTMAIDADQTNFTRQFLRGMSNTDYFKLTDSNTTEAKALHSMRVSKTQFVINIPQNFTYQLIRGERPNVLLTVDATDSMAAANAITAAKLLTSQVFNEQLQGPLSYLKPKPEPFNLIIHAEYNPELISQYTIVPGLLGIVLTMTLMIITAMAITGEFERGTMEFLLATPVRGLEVMLGKVIPYIIVGYVQLIFILVLAGYLFQVPIKGSILLLLIASLPFIFANLAIGITFSTIARNQLQATQMSFLFFLPSILLSGFMFPFHGMPAWAQWIGNVLPLTYYLRIVRGILLKGNGLADTWPNIWPIIVFMVVALMISMLRYRKTLD